MTSIFGKQSVWLGACGCIALLLSGLAGCASGHCRSYREIEYRNSVLEYSSLLARAQHAIETHEHLKARMLLDLCDPSQRGWEWGWLSNQADSSIALLRSSTPHDGWILHHAKSGMLLHRQDHKASLLDSVSLTEIHRFESFGSPRSDPVISEDWRLLATTTGALPRTIRVWDVASGEQLSQLTIQEQGIRAAAFSPGCERLLTLSDQWDSAEVGVWDIESGSLVFSLTGHEGRVRDAKYSADGTQILTVGGDRTARLWDASTGDEIGRLELGSPGPGTGSWANVHFVGRGRIATNNERRTFAFWDPRSGEALGGVRDDGRIVGKPTNSGSSVGYIVQTNPTEVGVVGARRPDITTRYQANFGEVTAASTFRSSGIAVGSADGTIRVWRARTDRVPLVLRGHNAPVLSIQISSTEPQRMHSLCQHGEIRVWDIDQAESPRIRHDRLTDAIMCGFEQMRLHDQLVTNGLFAALPVVSLPISLNAGVPDATAHGHLLRVQIRNRHETLRELARWQRIARQNIRDDIESLLARARGLSPEQARIGRESLAAEENDLHRRAMGGKRLILDFESGSAFIVGVGSSAQIKVEDCDPSAIALYRFSACGDVLVCIMNDGTTRVWNGATGTYRMSITDQQEDAYGIVFADDPSRIAVIGHSNGLRIWDLEEGTLLGEYVVPGPVQQHDPLIRQAVFAFDDSRLLLASKSEILVLEASTGVHLASIRPPSFREHTSVLGIAAADDPNILLVSILNEIVMLDGMPRHARMVHSILNTSEGRRADTLLQDLRREGLDWPAIVAHFRGIYRTDRAAGQAGIDLGMIYADRERRTRGH